MRERVGRLIRQEVGALKGHGGDRRSADFQPNNVKLNGGNSATYALRRLKRDRPDLAEKVVVAVETGGGVFGGIS
jgi:hypothetical protein